MNTKNNKNNKQAVKADNNISTTKILILGIVFVLLAIVAFFYSVISKNKKPVYKKNVSYYDQFVNGSGEDLGEEGKLDLIEELRFQAVHGKYQDSYLNLMDRINELDTTKIDLKESKRIFSEYKEAKNAYNKVLKKLDNYEKDYKVKCFMKMRTLIMAVLYADKYYKKRVTKFVPEKLIEIGALTEVPVCPRGGKYSIIYKDKRRLFSCSIHGILKNSKH